MNKKDLQETTYGNRLVYFAAERTLLSWVRTALAMMALGFVVDRFGLFLRQILEQAEAHLPPKPLTFWAGTTLVTLGVVMTFIAAVRYFLFAFRYRREGKTEPGHGLTLGLVFALLAGVVGAAIVVFIITVTD